MNENSNVLVHKEIFYFLMATNGAFTYRDVYEMKVPIKRMYIKFLEELNEKNKKNETNEKDTSMKIMNFSSNMNRIN